MRLAVTAGSLYESDDERCYAHFVEHMAFNGTTHFPASELVKFLQREGAQFGPHINATTSPSRAARTSVTTLHTGVNIFRDFASLTSTNSRTSTSELIECSATSSIPRRGCRKEVIA